MNCQGAPVSPWFEVDYCAWVFLRPLDHVLLDKLPHLKRSNSNVTEMWSERAMNCSHQVVTALHFFLASPQHRSRTKSTQENQQLSAKAYKWVKWTWKFSHLKYMPNWPHLSLHDPCRTWLWPWPAGGWTGQPHSSREHLLWSSRSSGREHSLSSCLAHVLNNGDNSETRTGMCYLVGKEDILKWRAHAAHRN